MNIIHNITMDFHHPGSAPRIHAVQGDSLTRQVAVTLLSGGQAWTIPSGIIAGIRYRKPDGTGGSYDCLPDGTAAWNAEGNVITFDLAPQMLTVPGCVEAQVVLVLDMDILSTFTFQLIVAKDPALGALQSEDYVNWLQWTQEKLQDAFAPRINRGIFSGDINIVDNADNLHINSVVWVRQNDTSNLPYNNYGFLETWGAQKSIYFQRITYIHGTVCTREYFNGAWTDWVFENPPMLTETEYMTPERLNGKNVYTKLIYIGSLPNSASLDHQHGITGITGIIRYDGFAIGGSAPNLDAHPNITQLEVNASGITITTNADLSGLKAYFRLYYIK